MKIKGFLPPEYAFIYIVQMTLALSVSVTLSSCLNNISYSFPCVKLLQAIYAKYTYEFSDK